MQALYKTKTLAPGSIDKCKSHLVAQEYLQTHGLDYTELSTLLLRLPLYAWFSLGLHILVGI